MIPLMRSISIATVHGSGVPQASSPEGVSGAPRLSLLHDQLRLNPGESDMLGLKETSSFQMDQFLRAKGRGELPGGSTAVRTLKVWII